MIVTGNERMRLLGRTSVENNSYIEKNAGLQRPNFQIKRLDKGSFPNYKAGKLWPGSKVGLGLY